MVDVKPEHLYFLNTITISYTGDLEERRYIAKSMWTPEHPHPYGVLSQTVITKLETNENKNIECFCML